MRAILRAAVSAGLEGDCRAWKAVPVVLAEEEEVPFSCNDIVRTKFEHSYQHTGVVVLK